MTTVIVGVLIAFCAVLLAKWLAVAALAGLVLFVALRFALRRVAGRRRARGRGRTPVVGSATGGVPSAAASGPPCSWCGRDGGHRDLRGRRVRPRHAHALPTPAREAS